MKLHKKSSARLVNLLIKAYAGYSEICSQEALWTIGVDVLGGGRLTLDEKTELLATQQQKIDKIIGVKAEVVEALQKEFAKIIFSQLFSG